MNICLPVAARATALLLLAPTCVSALDYQLHGSAAQGYAYSDGNLAYGSSENGSVDFYELGLNGSVELAPGLLASGQLLVRDAGANDNGALRLDYGLLDYQFARAPDYQLGLRAGRVKNPFGLYNDTRDVVFARPGIQLPQSIYFEGQGLRGLLFSSDGGQVYGGRNFGDHYLSAVFSAGLDRELDRNEARQVMGGNSLPGRLGLSHFYLGRLQDEWNGGADRLAFSYLHTDLDFDPDPGVPLQAHADFRFYVLSLRHDAARYSLSGEYAINRSTGASTGTGAFDTTGEGFYVQGDYHLDDHWSLMARYDATYADRNDRHGRDHARAGGDRHSRYAEDVVLGLRWLPDEHWGAWAEWHHTRGTMTVPTLDNVGRPREPTWDLVLLMVGYRF